MVWNLDGGDPTTATSVPNLTIPEADGRYIRTINSTLPDASGNVAVTAGVSSVAGRTGAITLAEGDVTNLTTHLASKADLVAGKLSATQIPTSVVQSVNGTAPTNGDVTVAVTVDPTSTVPYHDHVRTWSPITYYNTRSDGTVITVSMPDTPHSVIFLNDNATINLGHPKQNYSAFSSPVTGQLLPPSEPYHGAVDRGQATIMRDPYGNFPFRDWTESGQEMTIMIVQDDAGAHTVNWQQTTNGGTAYSVAGYNAASLSVSGVTGTAVPAPVSTASIATYYRFRWMGWQIGWMMYEYSPNVTLQFSALPSSLASGAPTYFRAFETTAPGSGAITAGAKTQILSAISTYLPTNSRKLLYNLGFTWEFSLNTSFSVVSGTVGGALGLTNEWPATAWVNPNTAAGTSNGIKGVICHEFAHALDMHMYRENNGVTVTVPDAASYYWAPSRYFPFGVNNQVTAAAGSTRTAYLIHDDPAIQNMWLASKAAFDGGGTSINSYYVYGPSGVGGGANNGGMQEWTAQMLGGYLLDKVDNNTSMMAAAATPAIITQFKTWATNNTLLQSYMV
ncbi:MAG: hypothetical protein WC498_04225 [Candidatus Saccharimonadales bacterium]